MKSLCDINRLLNTLNRKTADRVPNFEVLLDARAVRHILKDDSAGTFWEIDPADAVKVTQVVGQDAVVCNLTWTPEGLICNDADAGKVQPPPVEEAVAKLKRYTDAVEGTGLGVCARLSAPLSLVYNTTGPVQIESFMYMLYDNRPLIDRLMDMYLDYSLRMIDAIKDLPYHFYYLGDDVSSTTGPLISPDHMESLWAPPTKKLVDALHATGRPIMFHCCGTQEPILPYLTEWGVEATHPLQPGANDIYDVKKEYGHRLTLVGNMDIAGVLWKGTPEEVAADTREHLNRLSGDNGYVVCSSHSIIDDVPPENYMAMVREAWKTGN